MIHWSVPVMGLGKFLIILGKNCKISVWRIEGNITNYRIRLLRGSDSLGPWKSNLILIRRMFRWSLLSWYRYASGTLCNDYGSWWCLGSFLLRKSNFMFDFHWKQKRGSSRLWGPAEYTLESYHGLRRSKDYPEVREVIGMLHEKSVMCMISTAPSDDKLSTPKVIAEAYRMIIPGKVWTS